MEPGRPVTFASRSRRVCAGAVLSAGILATAATPTISRILHRQQHQHSAAPIVVAGTYAASVDDHVLRAAMAHSQISATRTWSRTLIAALVGRHRELRGLSLVGIYPTFEPQSSMPIGAMVRLRLPSTVGTVTMALVGSHHGRPTTTFAQVSDLRALDAIYDFRRHVLIYLGVEPQATDAANPSRAVMVRPVIAPPTAPVPRGQRRWPVALAGSSQRSAVSGPLVTVRSIPGDGRTFSTYDFRQPGRGSADWPVTFIFQGHATVAAIARGLCHGSLDPWKYCDHGGPAFLFTPGRDPATPVAHFLSSDGLKRFAQSCTTPAWTAHIRLYALASSSRAQGPRTQEVIGTAHLDFQDRSGCADRAHGYPAVAAQWLLTSMRSIRGWTVKAHAWNLGNATSPYVMMRQVGGEQVPHFYGQDGLVNEVVIR